MPSILYSADLPAADTTLVTTSGSAATVSHLFAVNSSGAAVMITATAHRAISGSVDTIVNSVAVPANSATDLLYDPQFALGAVVLEPGDTLHASASTGSVVLVTATS